MAKRSRSLSSDITTDSPPSKVLRVLDDDISTDGDVDGGTAPTSNADGDVVDINHATNTTAGSDFAFGRGAHVISYGAELVYPLVHGYVAIQDQYRFRC